MWAINNDGSLQYCESHIDAETITPDLMFSSLAAAANKAGIRVTAFMRPVQCEKLYFSAAIHCKCTPWKLGPIAGYRAKYELDVLHDHKRITNLDLFPQK